ncbi:unnamed protein product [Onchocerca flexuosa]|uniref:Uncharacterized protein n=1 Tax=Onchocerca flexuosa TaxID=387005 RepID=A0A183HQG1_9BILA|nr:unnamed protein product [Onchocerca flexuosa]
MQDKINEYIAQFPVIDAPESNKNGALHNKSNANVLVTWSQFEVQMMDIITALRHMLLAEIPRKSVIKGENLTALKLWVQAMKKIELLD